MAQKNLAMSTQALFPVEFDVKFSLKPFVHAFSSTITNLQRTNTDDHVINETELFGAFWYESIFGVYITKYTNLI